jgi:hypothetical protein
MNAPLHHPIKEAAAAVSRDWIAIIQPMMDAWEPVIVNGRPLLYEACGLAWAASKGYPGSTALYMGRSPAAPSVELIRAVANPPRETCPPVSFDVTAMDGGHDQRSAFRAWRSA